MKQHNYRITLEHLATEKGAAPTHHPIQFETGNHDDLFNIIENIRAKKLFAAHTSASLALGLKLLSEVMLENKDHPLFSEFKEPLIAFIGKIKSSNS